MRDPYFPIACAIATVLVLIPSPWHWKARNFGTLIFIFWTVVGNVIFFVKSIVWAGNLNNPAPIWCDIATKLVVGLGPGLPAASLCINRRLYLVASTKGASITRGEVLIRNNP
jgi:pheromone a factor receptor